MDGAVEVVKQETPMFSIEIRVGLVPVPERLFPRTSALWRSAPKRMAPSFALLQHAASSESSQRLD